MNWTQFLTGVAVCYAIYYGLNLLFDLLRSRTAGRKAPEAEELVIEDRTEPVSVGILPHRGGNQPPVTDRPLPNARTAISSGPIQATGGVDMRQLFALAQADAIQYTKAIPY